MQAQKKNSHISKKAQSGLVTKTDFLRNGAEKFAKRYGKVIKQLAKE